MKTTLSLPTQAWPVQRAHGAGAAAEVRPADLSDLVKTLGPLACKLCGSNQTCVSTCNAVVQGLAPLADLAPLLLA